MHLNRMKLSTVFHSRMKKKRSIFSGRSVTEKAKSEKKKSKDKDKRKSKSKKKSGFFSQFFSKKEAPPSLELSRPQNFRHESHIGWDPSAGFEIRNIPPEWKKLFQQAGVKKSELRNPETAAYMMGVISDAMVGAGETPPPMPDMSGPSSPSAPPPPPGPSAPAPPPPPPAPTGEGPPPPMGGPKSAPPPPPSGPNRGGSLLDQIQQGKNLKPVDKENPKAGLPSIDAIPEAKQKTLADTLAAAMAVRRADLDSDDEEEEKDSDWSE
eukprot:TRINITY_DN4081_c0_g3_i1.p1 TRINITY_DN4081_c0_g3~~TRINITY_DN4081_c0_g3_i1.p1  ORF type:complete len:267 (+),score=68.83 TRINITY_DN4081_c0_g3_i1:308-1108(+)